jgi:hypothetical protein
MAIVWLAFLHHDETSRVPNKKSPDDYQVVGSERNLMSMPPDPSIKAPETEGNSGEGKEPPNHAPASSSTPEPLTLPISREFVATLVTGPDTVSIALPDGRTASGRIDQRHMAADGSPSGASGTLTSPGKGRFAFHIQPDPSPAGPVVGALALDGEDEAYRVHPAAGGSSVIAILPADQVICRSYAQPPEEAPTPEEIPADHPINFPIPPYQNGVIPLQSRPGALGVIYLDFDGQSGPHENWGNFDASPTNNSNTTTKDVWARVSEDFAPFKLNVTTDLQVYLNAPETSRQRCIVTPTTTASPGAGGVAWVGSFGWTGDTPCWSFYSSGKNGAEVISHEIGHTLGLFHDGRNSPYEAYYLGHGSDPVGWAPIMGSAYYKNLSQWSRGEYLSANESQDDLAIIAGNFNVGYRPDDAGAGHATASPLEIFSGGVVNSEGTIHSQSDVDAFRFTTTGGSVNLAVATVSAGPNLDIVAKLHDASGNEILSNNPNSGVNATLVTSLAAGEYTVRVDGTGRGNPLGDGYTGYGSLGHYTIAGTIAGAVIPDRFTVNENPSPGAIIGTPVPRNNHAEAALAYSISAGNTGAAFSIDPETGVITVSNPSVLDYEALSDSWTAPPGFDLTIDVVDSLDSLRNESLRVVILVTNVNEPPLISGTSSVTVISHTLPGTSLATYPASDPDAYDFPLFSITAGNPSGKFSISQSGEITVTGDLDAAIQPTHALTIRVSDHGNPVLTTDLPVNITVIPSTEGITPGHVYHTLYNGIGGSDVSDLTNSTDYPTNPDSEIQLTSFTDNTEGNYYGSSIRAWMIAPYTGSYQFWISGDDSADLNFSATGEPSAATRICYLTSPSSYQQWTASPSQASATVNLTAGQLCYIEALHKEDNLSDHVSVAWEIKDTNNTTVIVPQEVIPGRYLAPHCMNYVPRIPFGSTRLYRTSYTGHSVTIPAVTDLNSADQHTWAISGGNNLGNFTINPQTGQISVANAAALAANGSPSVSLTLTATDNGSPQLANAGTISITLLDPINTPTSGLIQEFWDYVTGTQLSSLYALPRYPDRPDRLVDLTDFDSGNMVSDNYGARIRAYVIPPVTGSYQFYLASAKNGSLLLSPDSDPANAAEIASVDTFTSYLSWSAYPSQTSAPVNLVEGQRYYIVARVKESTGGDHLSVAWTGPYFPNPNVISDFYTEPFDSNVAPGFPTAGYSFILPSPVTSDDLVGTIVATDSPFEEIRYAIISGDPGHEFSIDPVSGQITVANATNLVPGSTFQLQVGAQDSGHGNHFAPKESLIPITITVPIPNTPPVFSSDPIELGSFPAAQPLSISIAPYVSDPGDLLTFSMLSGPSWLNLTPTGDLSGTPDFDQFGHHSILVSVNDGHGHIVTGQVELTISEPLPVPTLSHTSGDSQASLYIGSVQSGNALSASANDNNLLILRETASPGTSSLDYRWTMATPPGSRLKLSAEAYHTVNSEGDDFQFMVSTDGGVSFINAFLITKTTGDDTTQTFSFIAGSGNSTVVRVVDTNRTPGNNVLDRMYLDIVELQIEGNNPPNLTDTTLQVAAHAPAGVSFGYVTGVDPDAGQSLTFSIARGNGAGYFSISPSGTLTVATDIPEGAGPFTLTVVAIDDGVPALANYATVAVEVITPTAAVISLANLTPTYHGNPQPVISTTDPPGLPVVITYDGLPVPPVHAGDYEIVATIVDALYAGSTTTTQSIARAPATVALDDLVHTFDGTSKSAIAITTPPDLAVTITYEGSETSPTSAGTYEVIATISDPDYSGTITGSLEIQKANALVAIDEVPVEYDGSPKIASATTDPPGLNVVFLYDDSPNPPVNAGNYPITAVIDSENYSGSATGSRVITPAPVTIILGDLSQPYDGNPKSVSITTVPPGVAADVVFTNVPSPVETGGHAFTASSADSNYVGTATGSLEITKGEITITLSSLQQQFDGTPKPVTYTTSPEGQVAVVTYDDSPDPPTVPGSYLVSAFVDNAHYTGSVTGTLVIVNNLIIGTGQSFNPPGGSSTYQILINDGTLTFESGTLVVSSAATNHGVLRLFGDAVLTIGGTFTNSGIIDIINWNGTLPPGLINTGTILDITDVRPTATSSDVTHLHFSVPGFAGHLHQLESSPDLAGIWSPIDDPVPGSGSPYSPPTLEFSSLLDGPKRFYRVRITPAP